MTWPRASGSTLARRIHRACGLVFACSLGITAITGLLWAYAPHLYWEGGYLEKKAPDTSPEIGDGVVTISRALAVARRQLGQVHITSVELRGDFGRLVYEVQGGGGPGARLLLIDAVTGELLSPLTEQRAVTIARQYVRGNPEVESVSLLPGFTPRTGGNGRPAYAVRFRREGSPEIILDRDSGRILEEADRARRFHFLVMRLHQLSFLGFKKTLTAIPGVSLVTMVATGLVLWWVRRTPRLGP